MAELRQRIESGAERTLKLSADLSDAELFEAGAFEWAGNWPVARWISVNTTRQYETARTLIRKALKTSH